MFLFRNDLVLYSLSNIIFANCCKESILELHLIHKSIH